MIARLLALVVLLALPSLTNATTYWVSNAGGATLCTQNDGEADPLVYMTPALMDTNNCAVAGDTVVWKAGTYTGSHSLLTNILPSGSSGSVVSTHRCEGDHACIMAWSSVPVAGHGIFTSLNASHYRIGVLGNSFIIDCVNAGDGCGGVYLNLSSGIRTNVVVEDILVRNHHATAFNMAENQPTYYYDGVTFRWNESETPATPYYTAGGTDIPHPMYVKGRNVTVEYNKFVGFNLAQAYALHCYHICTNLIVRYNEFTVHPLARGYVGADNETALPTNNVIHNNVFRCPSANCGMAFDQFGSADNTNIFNNTIDGFATQLNNRAGNVNTAYKNNLCTNGACVITNAGTGLDCGGTCSTTNPTVTATSHFVDYISGDYSLIAGSSQINAGLNVGLPYNGSNPDRGAHETFTCTSGLVSANVARVQCNMAKNTPLIVGALSGWTVNNGRSVTSAVLSGSSAVDLTFDGAVCAGESWTAGYNQSPGTATDSAKIGRTRNQSLWDLGPIALTNNCSVVGYTFTQTQGAFYTALTSQETASRNYSMTAGGMGAVRSKFKATGGDPPAITVKLQYATDGESGTYVDVPDVFDAGNVRYVGIITTPHMDEHNTPLVLERLASEFSGMVAGSVSRCRVTCEAPATDLSQDTESERVDIIEYDTDATLGTTYHFRLVQEDGTVLTYAASSRPSVTIRAPSASTGF